MMAIPTKPPRYEGPMPRLDIEFQTVVAPIRQILITELPENERGYRISAERLAELALEYVRYRKPDGTIPQPHLDIVSALSELAALRKQTYG